MTIPKWVICYNLFLLIFGTVLLTYSLQLPKTNYNLLDCQVTLSNIVYLLCAPVYFSVLCVAKRVPETHVLVICALIFTTITFWVLVFANTRQCWNQLFLNEPTETINLAILAVVLWILEWLNAYFLYRYEMYGTIF
jgi:hypothetical protein